MHIATKIKLQLLPVTFTETKFNLQSTINLFHKNSSSVSSLIFLIWCSTVAKTIKGLLSKTESYAKHKLAESLVAAVNPNFGISQKFWQAFSKSTLSEIHRCRQKKKENKIEWLSNT